MFFGTLFRPSRSAAPVQSGTLRRLLSCVALAFVAGLVPPVCADDTPDPVVGQIQVPTNKPAEKKAPVDPEAVKRLEARAGALMKTESDWHAAYVRDPGEALSPEAQATLKLATDAGYDRTQALHDLASGGERVRPLIRNLDVGRHELLKHIYQRAMILANQRLAEQNLSPLARLQAVNAGGTGDYTRDQDITVFAGDEVREKAFFDAVETVARDELKLVADVKPTGGIDFPQLEVTFFRGSNDLPDARFATDVEEFALRYEKAIANQAADREAYKGGGADIEVKGRRVPGKMHVQQFSWENGRPVYVAETPRNFREGASMFSGTAPERWQRFERAAHIFSDYVQARQHSEGAHQDLSKGALKYAGRGIEHLCAIYGMKPWPELQPADRNALLRRIWPHLDPNGGQGARIFAQIGEALDAAVEVKTRKTLPSGMAADRLEKADKIALGFLQNATALTLSRMAQDMLNPPAYDSRAMRAAAGAAWDSMSAVERFRFARERDETFRAATGRASMENLLVAVSLLRGMDVQGGVRLRDQPGKRMFALAVAQADPELRPILTLAGDYAEAWVQRQQSSDPQVRAEAERTLMRVRTELKRVLPLAPTEMPSVALLRKAVSDGPATVLRAESGRGRAWLSPQAVEIRDAFMAHLDAVFPSHAEEWRGFRANVEQLGMKGYVARRVLDEAFQWDTLADALTLVEMYQGGASWQDYGSFIGINLVSRIHWGVGPLIQAATVKDAKAVKDLGKNLVFMTLSRVVPWAATVKIGFDVMRGTVVVTVGWAVNQANLDTIDAVYTGEAGRIDASAAGTVRGRLRDSGVSVLQAKHVRRIQPPGEPLMIEVDRNAVYVDAFRRWTSVDPDEVPRASPPPAKVAGFVDAHDAFVRLLMRQAEQFGPTWVQAPDKPFVPIRLDEKEVEAVLKKLEPYITAAVAPEVERVLSEAGVRGYRSIMEEEGTDVIREGLVRRYAADVLGGMIQHWQVLITAQILAARDIERTAMFQDMELVARQLHAKFEPSPTRKPPLEMRFEGKRLRPAPARAPAPSSQLERMPWQVFARLVGIGEAHAQTNVAPDEAADLADVAEVAVDDGLSFSLDAKVSGLATEEGAVLDGAEPLRLRVFLEGQGDFGDAERPIGFDVQTQTLKKVSSGTPGAVDDGSLKPGDVVEDRIVVRALAAEGSGPELARKEIVVRVRIPGEQGTMSVPLYRHEEKRRDGSIKERYTYFKRFPGMPEAWKSDGTEVYHGDYEVFNGDGSLGERRPYQYGVLDGKLEFFNSKGQLYHEVPYVKGVTHGDDIRYDPDSSGRQVYRYVNGRVTEMIATGTRGQPYVHITYDPTPTADQPLATSGTAQRWWASGQLRWEGSYANADQDLNSLGGLRGEEIRGKTGRWRGFHENGQLAFEGGYLDGREDGVHTTYDEQGRIKTQGAYVRGEEHGRWRIWEYGETRTDIRWILYDNGNSVDSGLEPTE